ncbi:helix-turn-helix domain-containing protein [Streptomyces neyagawaensis]|uniref:helix-turn-helix domain-containing protein n=1 Tax=Streptomyces neyagawaensis TaxID=42238 RepID=UPI0006E28C32|nr:helix-turn-helix domain-containing protein [Streptomyces neyagawaensis]MCL6736382.1 helix-turn-helix domain-containing protein [Streptomyces neyagawaensis]MDE1685996.1 helix-turn-helix domain-containing protein [Streptomyces neyagawaensis]
MPVVRELNAGRAKRGPDGLAVLDHLPEGPRRALVARLRMLREASGLTNEELVERLSKEGVTLSASRLSKFLNGHEVPSRAQVTVLHRLCDAAAGGESAPEAVKETQRLLYAVLDAERSAKPLRAKEFDLAETREQLEQLRVRTAADLSAMRDELERERTLRRQAEEALGRLVTAAGDHAREIGEIAAERDAARQRIVELEEQIRQHEAMLRLHDDDARHLDEMAAATARELVRYGSPEPVEVPEHTPDPTVRVKELVALVERLRDEDRDEEADQALRRVCEETPDLVPDLWQAFRTENRRLDAERLLVLTSMRCDGITLCKLWRTRRFGFEVHDVLMRERWVDDLVPVIASHTPFDELSRFVKACRERDESDALGILARSCRPRPFSEVSALRAAGLPIRWSLYWRLRAVVHGRETEHERIL